MIFTLYRLDQQKKEAVRVTAAEAFANAKIKGVDNRINLFNEAKAYLTTKKESLYFEKQIIKRKVGMIQIAKNIKPVHSAVSTSNIFVFGYDMDVERATEIFTKEFGFENGDPSATSKVDDTLLFTYADRFLKLKNDITERKHRVDFMKGVLMTCENGEVFTKNGEKMVVLVGTEHGHWGADTKKMQEHPEVWKAYSKESAPSISVDVSDGSKKERQEKLPMDRKMHTEAQLFDMAHSFNLESQMLQNDTYNLDKIKNEIIKRFKVGSTIVSQGQKKLVVTVKKAEHGRIMPDTEKMKANPEIWKMYSKKSEDIRLFLVRNLSDILQEDNEMAAGTIEGGNDNG